MNIIEKDKFEKEFIRNILLYNNDSSIIPRIEKKLKNV
jgi:hypothetical protein